MDERKMLYIIGLVNKLSVERAKDYEKWLEVGSCLFNIDSEHLFSLWQEFTKHHLKDDNRVELCQKMWDTFVEEDMGISTLSYWVKCDDINAYHEHNEKYHEVSFKDAITDGTPTDMASILHAMFEYEFVCASLNPISWYHFKNHRWIETEQGHDLRKRISKVLVEKIDKVKEECQNAVDNSDEDNIKKNLERLKKVVKLRNDVKTTKFKNDIMKECSEKFYIRNFQNELDKNPYLIGFENGVYDLRKDLFREGRPDDNISLTTGTRFRPFNPENKHIKGIREFLRKIQTNDEIREYLLLTLASYLQGNNKEETFIIWIGCGSNGKSKLLELLEKSFGEYCCKLPISALTQGRAKSNAATPEIAQTKGKRLASVQETEPTDKLNVGKMKEYTGGDVIYARDLFKSPVQFIPQWNLLMLCNHLPTVSSNDKGTWRRIRAIEFGSEFVDEPKEPHQFKKDMTLDDKFKVWKDYFLTVLFEYYKQYKTKGIQVPEAVMKYTKEYQKTEDYYEEFVDEHIELNEGSSYLTISNIYDMFKDWFKNCRPDEKLPRRKQVKEFMENKFGKMTGKGWRGIKLKEAEIEMDGVADLDFGVSAF
jgi:P4 family phage/plasmid primase-like protien